jgi:hypothetical protein
MAKCDCDYWQDQCERAQTRCENQAKTIGELRHAGNQLARVMEDILGSEMITCQISRAVMTASLAKWKNAKTAQ